MRALIVAAVACALGGAAMAQTAPKVTAPGSPAPQSFLYVGNSFYYFNNGITRHVGGLERGMNETVRKTTMATIGGSGLQWHDVESYLRPDAVGSYDFAANNALVFNSNPKKYDAVLMMDCSQCPIHPTLSADFVKYARIDADIVRKHGSVPMLFMSWAYADHPEMTAQLAEAYTKVGNENGMLVVPAGLAFARALRGRPDLHLYIEDNRHPTLAGTYLAAATTYGALQGKSPEPSSYTAGLDPELAQYLRATAWATVQAYYKGEVVN